MNITSITISDRNRRSRSASPQKQPETDDGGCHDAAKVHRRMSFGGWVKPCHPQSLGGVGSPAGAERSRAASRAEGQLSCHSKDRGGGWGRTTPPSRAENATPRGGEEQEFRPLEIFEILAILSDFDNLIRLCKSEVISSPTAPRHVHVWEGGGEWQRNLLYSSPSRWGAGQVVHSQGPGEGRSVNGSTDKSGRDTRYHHYAGHKPTCDRGRRAAGREVAPGGHSPASSAICLPDSEYFRWFRAAVDTIALSAS
jgi:hypothetical protein